MPRCPLPDGATRYRPARSEAGAYLPGLPLRDVTPLAVREAFELQVEHDIVDAKAYFALYRPSDPICAEACGDWAFTRDGFELVRFWLPSQNSAPCLLYLWCQVVTTFIGNRHVLTPAGLNLETKRHDWLGREVRYRLGAADVTQLMRDTGLPRAQIRGIAVLFRQEYRAYLKRSPFRPLVLGVDFVAGGRSRDSKYAVLTVTASDPRQIENVFIDCFEMQPGQGRTGARSDIVQDLKKALLSLNVDHLLAIALDGEDRLANLVREALRLAVRYNPALKKVRLALDRRHVEQQALEPLKAARNKIVQGLSKDDPLRDLLAKARYDLEEAPAFVVEADARRQRRLARVFKHFPDLKPLYEAFNGIRRIYDCPGRESAEIAFAMWWKGLSGRTKRRYQRFRKYVTIRWEMFLTYFDLKEETFRLYKKAYSLTSGFTESMNDEFKSRLKLARAASLDVFAARMMSAHGYYRAARRAKLKRARAARRAEKEAQAKSRGRAAGSKVARAKKARSRRSKSSPSATKAVCTVSAEVLWAVPRAAAHPPEGAASP